MSSIQYFILGPDPRYGYKFVIGSVGDKVTTWSDWMTKDQLIKLAVDITEVIESANE